MFGSLFFFAQVALTPLNLHEHYTYMGRGEQVKVYRSEEFKTCIKILDPHPCKDERYISFKGVLKRIRKRAIEEKKANTSYNIAFNSLRDETGLLGIYLKKEKLFSKPLEIIDEKGLMRTIDLNKTPFILQECMIPFEEALNIALNSGQKEAERLISASFEVMESILKKGYILKDSDLLKNWGLSPKGPLIIDAGQFNKLLSRNRAYRIQKMFAKSLLKLVMRYPQLSDHAGHLMRAKSAWWSESASLGSSPS